MADGSIVINARLSSDKALDDLKLLQAKAKSTAQQIGSIDKKISTIKGSDKLPAQLEKAKAAAAETAQQLERVNDQLHAAQSAELGRVKQQFPKMSDSRAADIASSRVQSQNAEQIAQSETLAAQLSKQEDEVARLSAEYDKQQQSLAALNAQRSTLSEQLKREQDEANAAAESYARAADCKKKLQKAEKSVQRFGRRLSGVVSSALVFNLVSAALRKLVDGLGTAIGQTDGLQSAFARLKGAAATAAAPIIEVLGRALTWLIDRLATAAAYIARLVSVLTGRSLASMKSSAKAMTSVGTAAGSTAKQVDKASRSLAGFDELERLDAPQDSTSGGGSGGTAADFGLVDTAPMDGLLDRVNAFWDAFVDRLAPSVAAWSAAWDKIKAAAMDTLPMLEQSLNALWKDGLSPLLDYFVTDFVPGFINGTSLILAPMAGDIVSSIIEVGGAALSALAQMLTSSINAWIIPALDLLKTIWLDLATAWNSAWETYISPVFSAITAMLQDVCGWVQQIWQTVVDPILSAVIAQLTELWSGHLAPLASDLISVVGGAINLVASVIKALWDDHLAPLANWLIDNFGPVVVQTFSAVYGIVSSVFGGIADVLDLGLIGLRGVIDYMRNDFAGNWEDAWNTVRDTVTQIWNVITDRIRGSVNSVIGFVNQMTSGIASGLNAIIGAMNNLSFTIPDWVPGIGGNHFGFNIGTVTAPQIPYLAQGAVIPPNREFLAVLGDQTSGTNVEAPLSTIQQAVAEVMDDNITAMMAGFEALRDELSALRGDVQSIEVGDEVIGRAARRWNRKMAILGGALW